MKITEGGGRCKLSGVYVRNRHLSTMEYFNTAVSIRQKVVRLATSSACPSSYRFVLAVPMAETARDLVFNLVKSDAFYPNTERNVSERRHYMTLAIACCEQLFQDLVCLKETADRVSIERFEELAETIDNEIGLLKSARKGVKLIGGDGRMAGRCHS